MPVEPESTLRQGFWKRFAKSLDAGRQAYVADMKEVFGRPAIDAGFWDDLEATLIAADAGARVTERVIDQLRNQAAGAHLRSPAQALGYLKADLLDEMRPRSRQLELVNLLALRRLLAPLTAGRSFARQGLMARPSRGREIKSNWASRHHSGPESRENSTPALGVPTFGEKLGA